MMESLPRRVRTARTHLAIALVTVGLALSVLAPARLAAAAPPAGQAGELLADRASQRRFLLAESAYLGGRWEQAINQIETLMDRDPRNPQRERLLHYLGEAHYQLGHLNEARRTYEGLIREFPEAYWVPHGHLRIGESKERDGRLEEARQAYTAVVDAADPDPGEKAEAIRGLARLVSGQQAAEVLSRLAALVQG